MDQLLKLIQDALGITPDIQYKIFISILIILALWLMRFITLRIVNENIEDIKIRYKWRKISTYITALLGFFIIGRTWFGGLQSIATYLGLVSAGIAIALKDLVADFAGWIYIIWVRPFEVGDRVEIGNFAGDVIDLTLTKFTLMEIGKWVDADQTTGRIIHIPNGKIFTDVLANYGKGFQFIWNEIPVMVSFESNWKKAKDILLKIIQKDSEKIIKSAEKYLSDATDKYMVNYALLTPTVYTSVKDYGVLLTIRYLCYPRQRRGSKEKIWETILEEFSEHSDIEYAYPTQRFFNHKSESKVKDEKKDTLKSIFKKD